MAKRRSGRSSDSEDQDDLEDEELEDDEDDPGDEDDDSSDDDQSSRRQSSSQSKQGEKSKSGEKTRTLTQTQLDIIIQREKRKAVRQVERRLRDGTESDDSDDSDDDTDRKGGSKRSPHTAELVTLRSERTRLEDENDELTGVVEEQIELLMQELPADVIDLLDLTDEKEPASKRLRRLLKAKERHETQKAAARRRKKDNPDDGDEERAPAGSRQDPPRRRSRGRKGRLDQMREELFRRSGGYSAID